MLKLAVNIDHVATIREARAADEPSPVWAAVQAELGGAEAIAFHLREDRRHIGDPDAELLVRTVAAKLIMHISLDAALVRLALRLRPTQCTLVPERRAEVTTEGGLDVARLKRRVVPVVRKLHGAGLEACAFVEPTKRQVAAAADCGFDAVELRTAAYVNAKTAKQREDALAALAEAMDFGHGRNLVVGAGQGLTYRNISAVAAIAGFSEFVVGHSVVARALMVGMREAVHEMKRLLDCARHRHVALVEADELLPQGG